MRRLWSLLAILATLLVFATPARAAEPEVQIHLLVMGPGEHLYTRGGHAALMVLELEDGEPVRNKVYNYGDTEWEDPLLVPNFLRGKLVFFLSDSGELLPTLEEYGVKQGREVTRQRLNLTPAQAREVARRLQEGVVPGKREYIFHHVHALCSTRIMDLLDDVLGGALRAQLGGIPGPETARYYQEVVFSGSPLASIGGDLFLGRLHERVLDRYESTAYPPHMSAYLQTVLVPAADGTGLIPLAEPPAPVVVTDKPIVADRSNFSRVVWGACIALLLFFGLSAFRRAGTDPARAARVVFWAALPSGVIGSLILGFILFSRVPEFRQNELILLFWPTDLWLAACARRFLTKRQALSSWVRRYATARFAAAGLVFFGHLTGLLYQRPEILAALGIVMAAVSWALVRSIRTLPALALTPARASKRAPARA
ncbi:MAG: DUF4105 domain-containing protein [Polyangiaceae bacterium]